MPSPTARKDAEYQYYTRKLAAASISVPANTHLNELRKVWHAHITNNVNKQETASDLEIKWLQTLTGVTAKNIRDCWEQAFVGLATGLKPPSTMEELQAMFYTFAP